MQKSFFFLIASRSYRSMTDIQQQTDPTKMHRIPPARLRLGCCSAAARLGSCSAAARLGSGSAPAADISHL